MNCLNKKYAFTCGDINGIGPEIIVKSLLEIDLSNNLVVVIIPEKIIVDEIEKNNFDFEINYVNSAKEIENYESGLIVFDIPCKQQDLGCATKESGLVSFNSINIAIELAAAKIVDAIITAPISKLAFSLAGINFPGHTELLSSKTNSKDHVMMFLSEHFHCALATIHEPISNISKLLTVERLTNVFSTVYFTLKNDLQITKPKIAVLSLNPHAGEKGKIGNEEIEIIEPAIRNFNYKNLKGPFVPDAFFGMNLQNKYDCIIGMYHDQVLIPFKMLNFNSGVNFTAGLNIIRTSPDHGTAFDIAGKGIADPKSFVEAIKWAAQIIENRRIKN